MPAAFIAAVAMFVAAHAAWLVAAWPSIGTDGLRACVAWAVPCAVAAVAAATPGHRRDRRSTRVRSMRAAMAVAASVAGFSLAAAEAVHGQPGDVEGPVTLVGTVTVHPRPLDSGMDELSRWIPAEAAQRFTIAATACIVGHDEHPLDREVSVRVAGLDPMPARGSVVRVRGWLRVRASPAFPGSRRPGTTVTLEVPSSRFVNASATSEPLRHALVSVRSILNDALLASLPGDAGPSNRALVSAMTTGVRLHGLEPVSADFRLAGMSHVLAISGFNVAILVGAAAAAARALGARPASRGAVAIVVAAAFLAVTEPETSVLRAGWGAVLAACASVRGGHARGLGTLGAVACVAMAVDVDTARSAGFQLSHGAVAALLVVAPRVDARWRSRIDRVAGHGPHAEHVRFLAGPIVSGTAAACVAWSVTTPIALAHVGHASALAVPLSLASMPAAAAVTVCGCVAMAVGCVAPGLALAPGWLASACAASLEGLAAWASDVRWGGWWTGTAPAWWCVGVMALAWASWTLASRARRRTARAVIAVLAVALWAGWTDPGRGPPNAGVLEVVRIPLGRGTCSLVRWSGSTVLVDPGHAFDPSAGSRRLVPALAELGVRRIDAVVMTDRSIACVSCLPEVVRSMPVGWLVELGEPVDLGDAPDRPSAWRDATRAADARGVLRTSLAGGESRRVGSLVVEAIRHERGDRVLMAATVRPSGDSGVRCEVGRGAEAHARRGTPREVTRLRLGPDGRAVASIWDGQGWVGVETTTARSNSTQSPTRLPSSDNSSMANPDAARSARSSHSR